MTQAPPRGRFHPYYRDAHDSIGMGKLTENQMRGVIELIKARGILNTTPPEPTGDHGIVIAGGGRYAPHSYANARWLRMKGVQLPIQIWHLGGHEFPAYAKKVFGKLDVELVDTFEVREKHWHKNLKGFYLKHYAAKHAPWQHVAFYDADCFAALPATDVFNDPEYQDTGALFFSDIKPCATSTWHYCFASVRIPDHEFESGVFFWDRTKAWRGICMTTWMGEHANVWSPHTWGDKELGYLGFGTTDTPFIQSTEREWFDWGIQQSWKGRVVGSHAMAAKRLEAKWPDPMIPGLMEEWRSFGP